MAALHIKKGDNVVVLSGDDKGVRGEVIAVSPEEGKVRRTNTRNRASCE